MTSEAVADLLGMPARTVTHTIANARREFPGKRFRIVRYEPVIGRRTGDLPVYAAQAGPDAARQPYDHDARRRAIRQRHQRKYGAIIRSKERARRAQERGETPVCSPWQQLMPPGVRMEVQL